MILICIFSLTDIYGQISGKKSSVGTVKDPAVSNAPKPEKVENKCCSSNGDIQVWKNLSRSIAPEENMLPIAAGNVSSDAAGIWISPLASSTVERVSAGRYKLTILNARISLRSSIIITPLTTIPRICTAKFIGTGVFEVYAFNLSGDPVDVAFSFIINDPMNLSN